MKRIFGKKLLLSVSIVIMLCTIIVSGTFALFTDTINIKGNTVTAGSVDIDSSLSLVSGGTNIIGAPVNIDPIDNVISFSNGGTAKIDEKGSIAMENITPGDYANFKLSITNNSTTNIKFKTIISLGDSSLLSSLIIKGFTIENGFSVANWVELSPTDTLQEQEISIELPISVGNDYQGKAFSFDVTVYAIQSNGDSMVSFANDLESLKATPAGGTAYLISDIDAGTNDIVFNSGLDINFNGKTITCKDLIINDASIEHINLFNGTLKGNLVVNAQNASVKSDITIISGDVTVDTSDHSFYFDGQFKNDLNEIVDTGKFIVKGGKLIIGEHIGNAIIEVSKGTATSKTPTIEIPKSATVTITVSTEVTEKVVIENSGTVTDLTNNSASNVDYVGNAGSDIGNISDENANIKKVINVVVGDDDVQAKVAKLTDGDTVVFGEGAFNIFNLSVSKGITLRGAGKNKTILSSSALPMGADASVGIISVVNIKNESVVNTVVTITDMSVVNTIKANNIRSIFFGNSENVELKVENCYVESDSKSMSWDRGISTYELNTCVLTINDSEIFAPRYYALNFTITNKSIVVNVTNSLVSGWAAINSFASESTFNIKESTLIGTNVNSGNYNGFSAIVLDGNQLNANQQLSGQNNELNFESCTITAIKKGDASSGIMAMNYGASGNTSTFTNCTFEVFEELDGVTTPIISKTIYINRADCINNTVTVNGDKTVFEYDVLDMLFLD